jgi:hypothetical protein
MSSEIPIKPIGGGNNVFIAASVVMLLAVGGLVTWKLKGSSSSSPEPTAAASFTAGPNVHQPPVYTPMPPPPPPPPSEEHTASPSAVSPANATVRSGKSYCPSSCEGSVTAALSSALAGRGGAGRRCYEKSLSQNQSLRGHMTVSVRVGTNGSVCSASVVGDELHEPGLTNCIIGVFRASILPAPQNGCVDVKVPLNFVPSK